MTVAALAGCGSTGSSDDGTAADSVDLSGVRLAVGSKNFTEQKILGALTIEMLQAAGATVEDRTGQGSTSQARESLLAGATDMYWEYTGTAWLVILDHEGPVADEDELFDAVAREDMKDNDIAWIKPPAPADNTYAIAVREEVSDSESADYDEDLARVESLSDLDALVEQSPDKATMCVASEFANREDGLPGLEAAYGFSFPSDGVFTLNSEDVIYQAVDRGQSCSFGEVFRTDGRIDSMGLRLLEDDEDFFPPYNPALTVRAEVLKDNPGIEKLIAPLAEQLDEQTLQQLSTAVDVQGRPVQTVARDFLNDAGILEPHQLTK